MALVLLALVAPSDAAGGGGDALCNDEGVPGLDLNWSERETVTVSLPERTAAADLRWHGYDGVHHDDVVVSIDGSAATTFDANVLDEVAASFERQGVLDLSGPIAVRPRLLTFDDAGSRLGTADGPYVDIVWENGTASVLEPELGVPDPALLPFLPEGVVVLRRAVSSKVSEPAQLAVSFDNRDKADDHLPAVAKNLDLDRPLIGRDAFLAIVGDTYTEAEAEALYVDMEAADAERRSTIELLRAEVTQ